MSLANSLFFWLLFAVPPAMILFFWWSWRERQRLMTQFIRARLLPGLVAGVSPAREKLRAALLILAVCCSVFTLAGPRWGYDVEEVTQRGLDIVIVIDTSKSMLARDIAPNRLERAKLAALDLMRLATTDRLGLVAFAGSAFLECPLTIDDVVFRQSVDALDVNTIPEGGTALADAIMTACKAFKEGDNYKAVVLFTDGEDHDSGALEAAKAAAKSGVRIFTVGIGTAEGELIRIKSPDGQDDFVRDENGNVVKSHLNEALLQQIAGSTEGGFYLPLRGASVIDTLYQKGLAPLPKSQVSEKWVKRPHERYQWPLTAAIVLLLFELLLPERKPTSKRGGEEASPTTRPVAAAVVLAGFVWLTGAEATTASPAGALREYRSGRFEQALKEYEESLAKRNDDSRLQFNAGAAAYRSRQFEQAAKHFDQASSAQDLNLQEQAYYNLGNTLFRMGEENPDPTRKSDLWQQSLQKYESGLKLNAADADARFNHEFVKKKLEELKQQQQQQQQKQNNQDKNQDKNQRQSQNQNQEQPQDKDQSQQNQQQQQQPNSQENMNNSGQQQQQKQQQAGQQPQQQQQEQRQGDQQKQAQPAPKPEQSGPEQQQQQQARATGEMSPREAERLLDSEKNDELMLPVSKKQKPTDEQRVVKDW